MRAACATCAAGRWSDGHGHIVARTLAGASTGLLAGEIMCDAAVSTRLGWAFAGQTVRWVFAGDTEDEGQDEGGALYHAGDSTCFWGRLRRSP